MKQLPTFRSLFAGLLHLVLITDHGALAALNGACPPLGPVLPPATNPSTNAAVQGAAETLKQFLDKVTATLNYSAVSVAIQSVQESKPMFEYHFTPPSLDSRGVSTVDADSVYRLASVSKLFPVLATLQLSGVSLEDPVTKYLPELLELKKQQPVQNAITVVDWDEITLGALASHMGGLPADLMTDLTNFEGPWSELGLPPVDDSEKLRCSGLYKDTHPCNETDFFNHFGRRPPVYAPFTSPVYSNIGPALLGLVVERVTNKKFEVVMQSNILDVVGMKHTFPAKPDDSLGVIPVDDPWWDDDIGILRPSGNYYSSTSDMLAFGLSILKYKLLSPAKTRKWLKPLTSTSSAGYMIGAPWEILRVTNVTKDERYIEFYTKGGDLATYNSGVFLIPDYDLVITILQAGPETSGSLVQAFGSEASKAFLPALEQAGKEGAQISYAGTYADESTNSSLVLALDDGPGFRIANLTIKGVDVIANYYKFNIIQAEAPPDLNIRLRLYPVNLETEDQKAWRSATDYLDGQQTEVADAAYIWPQGTCVAWGSLDRLVWNMQSLDAFIFNVTPTDGGVTAASVELPAFQVTLKRDSTT